MDYQDDRDKDYNSRCRQCVGKFIREEEVYTVRPDALSAEMRHAVWLCVERAGRIGLADWIVTSVKIGFQRLADQGIDRGELPALRVVVAVDEVDQPRRVGVPSGEAKWRGTGKAARRLGVAPGIVARAAGEGTRVIYGTADR